MPREIQDLTSMWFISEISVMGQCIVIADTSDDIDISYQPWLTTMCVLETAWFKRLLLF